MNNLKLEIYNSHENRQIQALQILLEEGQMAEGGQRAFIDKISDFAKRSGVENFADSMAQVEEWGINHNFEQYHEFIQAKKSKVEVVLFNLFFVKGISESETDFTDLSLLQRFKLANYASFASQLISDNENMFKGQEGSFEQTFDNVRLFLVFSVRDFILKDEEAKELYTGFTKKVGDVTSIHPFDPNANKKISDHPKFGIINKMPLETPEEKLVDLSWITEKVIEEELHEMDLGGEVSGNGGEGSSY